MNNGGQAYYLDGGPTPNSVRSSWDFISRRPPFLVDFQHCQQVVLEIGIDDKLIP